MTVIDVWVNAGRKKPSKIKEKTAFFPSKLYSNHIFMVSPAASFHSTVVHLYFSFFPPHFYSLCVWFCNFSSIFLPSFLSGPLLSARTDQWNVNRTKDSGLPDSFLGLLVPSCSPHFQLSSYSFSISDECFVYFCSYELFCSCFYSTLLFRCRLN